MDNFIVTTTDSLEGYKIDKYIELCSERIVVGTGLFSEFFAGLSDVFGGRSSKFEARLNELYEEAIEKLTKSAKSKGANCLVGVKIDIDEISGKNMQMFMINVAGTAVTVKKLQDSAVEGIIEKKDKQISGNFVKQKVISERLVKELMNISYFGEITDVFRKANDENILIPIEAVLKSANALAEEVVRDYAFECVEAYTNYLESYDQRTLNHAFEDILWNSGKLNEVSIRLYGKKGQPNYRLISKLIDDISFERLEDSITPLLLKYSDNYFDEDKENIEQICSKLNNLIHKDIAERTVGTFSKELWLCPFCGAKVSMNDNKCRCGRGKNGIPYYLSESIDKVINFLNEILSAID